MTDYDRKYFEDINRYAPFNYLYPLTRRSNIASKVVLKIIETKEDVFASRRTTQLLKLGIKSSLDVGCANGELVKKLIDNKIDAYGVDISEYQVNLLNQTMKGRFILASAVKLPFKNQRFDVVSSFHTLEHIPSKEIPSSLKEMARVSRKYLVFEFPTEENFNARIDPTHISVLSSEEWIKIFTKTLGNEWKFIKLRRSTYLKPFYVMLQRKLA